MHYFIHINAQEFPIKINKKISEDLKPANCLFFFVKLLYYYNFLMKF